MRSDGLVVALLEPIMARETIRMTTGGSTFKYSTKHLIEHISEGARRMVGAPSSTTSSSGRE